MKCRTSRLNNVSFPTATRVLTAEGSLKMDENPFTSRHIPYYNCTPLFTFTSHVMLTTARSCLCCCTIFAVFRSCSHLSFHFLRYTTTLFIFGLYFFFFFFRMLILLPLLWVVFFFISVLLVTHLFTAAYYSISILPLFSFLFIVHFHCLPFLLDHRVRISPYRET